MIFWWICGRESGFPVPFLHHLGTPLTTPILFSQSLETAILLSVSRNLPALDTSSKWSHVISVLWDQLLTSLSIMSLSFMHVAACVRISFSLKAEWCSTVCVYHVFCLCIWWTFVFYLLTVMNYAAMKFGVQISVRILGFNFLSISPIPRVELWNHMIIICLIFLELPCSILVLKISWTSEYCLVLIFKDNTCLAEAKSFKRNWCWYLYE